LGIGARGWQACGRVGFYLAFRFGKRSLERTDRFYALKRPVVVAWLSDLSQSFRVVGDQRRLIASRCRSAAFASSSAMLSRNMG
jgi:hypothetical protein